MRRSGSKPPHSKTFVATLLVSNQWYGPRGKGNATIFFEMAQSMMGSHVSRFPWVFTGKRTGMGRVLTFSSLAARVIRFFGPRVKKRIRVDWAKGSIVIPPEGWFNQHFNSGTEPARYLALKVISRKFKFQPGKIQSDVPLAYGGWQIEYEDEDPEIRHILRRNVRNRARR